MPNAIPLRRLKWYDITAADDRGNVMQSIRLNRIFGAGAFVCAFIGAASAQTPTPQWQKVCQASPDTNCATFVQPDTGANRNSLGVQILEPTRDSTDKLLRIIVFRNDAPASDSGTIEIVVDAKRFAEMQFSECPSKVCAGQRPITEAEIGLLERAKTIEVKSGTLTLNLPVGNLAEVRAARGMSADEYKEAQARSFSEAIKQAEAKSKKLAEETAKPPRDPDKENCGSVMLEDREAIAACDRAIKSGKYKGRELADLYHTRGLSHGSNGRPELGNADFNAAIRADPSYAPAYAERGDDYLHARKFDLAIKDFNEALRLGGEDTTVLFSRGLAYRSSGQRALAIADFRRVYKLNPRIGAALDALRELGVEP